MLNKIRRLTNDKESILEIYALSVCFVALVVFTISSCIGIYNIISLIKPEFTISSYEYSYHLNNDSYWKNNQNNYNCDSNKMEKSKEIQRPSEEILTKQRQESYSNIIKVEKRKASQSLVQILIIFIACTFAFVLHWLIARKSSESNNANS